jgi:putative DNA-invertase from lambdoid prophage Rac
MAALDAIHIEPGISGAIAFSERPEGGKLWAELRRGDTVVAAKLDRMFRSAADCLTVVEAFKARGVSLYLLDLNGGADDVSGNGIARLFLTIVSAFAEFERVSHRRAHPRHQAGAEGARRVFRRETTLRLRL